MLSFIFGGLDSYIDFGIVIAKRPNIPAPKRRVSYIDIPGRDSSLRYDEATYEDVTIAVECGIKGLNIPESLDAVKGWLYAAGESDLIFSFQPDRKYRAQVVNAIDFKQGYRISSQFVILFNCRPFKYSVSNDPVIITSGLGSSLPNQGTVNSRPVIKAYGAGDGSFTIKGRQVLLSGITSGNIILDSELEETYYLQAGEPVNASNNMSGEFPVLDTGNNIITFTGGLTRLEITPNWRWL